MNSRNVYQRRVDNYSRQLDKLSKSINFMGMLRLFVVAAIIATFVFANRLEKDLISWSILVVWILLFVFLVGSHRRLKDTHKYMSNLLKVNEEAIMRVEGRWTEFLDKGEDFKDEHHNYSYDLDIVGQGSIFQWINTGSTYIGRSRLADILTHPNIHKETILKRQEAIEELSNKRWWRQRLQVEGRMILEKNSDVGALISWAKTRNLLYSKKWMRIALRLLPMITVVAFLWAYVGNGISQNIPISLFTLQTMLLFINIGKRNREFALVYNYKNSIKIYGKILRHLEKTRFHSEYLRRLKEDLGNTKEKSATKQLKRLEAFVDRIENRNNMLFLPINVITLWDYQCLVALEQWKSEAGFMLEEWMQKIGEIEALSSLGTIAYDHPDWSIPHITEEPSVIEAKQIGHPLLTNRQICNDVNIKDPYGILLITGSNMSGKSTFLRTIGVNLVLAYAGAPVCAKTMKCSIFSIHTCMRISDNLDKGISSFYGELLRIKEIIEATKKGGQVFFLLDEIFKGTNSYDRHIGAKKLIKQLERNGAIGLVSTHDLELGVLEKENHHSIKNYHFQEYYKDGQIHFDYKLQPGLSTTRNALYLMKMIGIEE